MGFRVTETGITVGGSSLGFGVHGLGPPVSGLGSVSNQQGASIQGLNIYVGRNICLAVILSAFLPVLVYVWHL